MWVFERKSHVNPPEKQNAKVSLSSFLEDEFALHSCSHSHTAQKMSPPETLGKSCISISYWQHIMFPEYTISKGELID